MALKERLLTGPLNAVPISNVDESVAHYRSRLLQDLQPQELEGLDSLQKRARLERVLGGIVSREGPLLSDKDRNLLIRRVVDESLGLGVLEPLLADEDITEIMVNGPFDVFVERAGRLERVDTVFASDEHLLQTIERIVSGVNRRVDESSPMVDARLPTGERVNVIVPPLALNGAVLTIRRFPRVFSLDELQTRGSFDGPTRDLLELLVQARCNIIVSGGTGSGKTTLLNSLSEALGNHERIITIEDAAELSLRQEHVVRLESRPANVEGRGAVSIRDLVRNSLRMRPDRIIVGEVRGGETLDMLQAMNTGHEGSLATVHANSAEDALSRLETLASMSDVRVPGDTLRDQINSAVDVIIHLQRFPSGSRRVVEVSALVSRQREPFRLESLCGFEADPVAADGVVRGSWILSMPPPSITKRLAMQGLRLPDSCLSALGEQSLPVAGP